MNLPTIIEQSGQRVLTTAQLAEAYGTDSKVISKNFTRNKKHYQEGKHFYCLTGEELEKFAVVNLTITNYGKARKLYLWTERGALFHAKSLNTDKAWEVYEFLVDSYFRAREAVQTSIKLSLLEQKLAEQQALQLELAEKPIQIYNWMVSELNLKGNELLVYAIIHEVSKDQNRMFTGSARCLAELTNCTRRGIIRNLESLVMKDYIGKTEEYIGSVKFCGYYAKEVRT